MEKYSMQDIEAWIEEAVAFNKGFSTNIGYSAACSNIAIAMMMFNEQIENENNRQRIEKPYRQFSAE